MYYYYWFAGRRLLNQPIEALLRSDLDFPFCIMWANENWTRRWDGDSQDVLLGPGLRPGAGRAVHRRRGRVPRRPAGT